MFLDRYHSLRNGKILIDARQGSRFAKEIAGDFNPIHNPDARRFCVPGDLVFALLITRFGLARQMTFDFRSLLGASVPLSFDEEKKGVVQIRDDRGKVYIEMARNGESTRDQGIIEDLARNYVAASGKNFPNTLIPLMRQKGVMINPDRPMIMYQSMTLSMYTLNAPGADLELENATLVVEGKRGHVTLDYRLLSQGKSAGQVCKKLIVSGLREYDEREVQELVEEFYQLKQKAWD